MENNYIVFDLIRSLRGEYNIIQHEIDELKSNIILPKNRKNLQIFLNMKGQYDEKAKLMYKIDRKDPISATFKFVDFIANKGEQLDLAFPIVKKDKDYFFACSSDILMITNQEEFNNRVKLLLSCPYAENANFEYENNEFAIDVALGRVYVRNKENDKELFYIFASDEYNMYIDDGGNGIPIKDGLTDFLSYKIPESNLSDYYKEIIEKNKSLRKDI